MSAMRYGYGAENEGDESTEVHRGKSQCLLHVVFLHYKHHRQTTKACVYETMSERHW